MVRHHMPTVFIMCLLLVSSNLFANATTLPEEASAPLSVEKTPRVRYWQSAVGIDLPTTIGPSAGDSLHIPIRDDPKIVPVLYHNIVFGRTGNIYNRDIYNFEHDLAFLRRNYEILDFEDLVAIERGEHTLDTDGTIITFDDGDLSIYAIVFPLLKELGMKATFFIVPNFIGEVGYMSWAQVREMANYRTQDGERLFTFGSHSLTHRPLGELPEDELLFEMKESKRILEEELGYTVDVIALPFGSGAGDAKVIAAARKAGYHVVRTSQPKAIGSDRINLMNVNTFNVENYSTDVFVQRLLRLTGR